MVALQALRNAADRQGESVTASACKVQSLVPLLPSSLTRFRAQVYAAGCRVSQLSGGQVVLGPA